ncbi:MAG TPA: hypothetical protein PKA95_16275 [Thermomicrobiales bacterium]|nr:hypothetical protein [Thermomicrobiales bacterium]
MEIRKQVELAIQNYGELEQVPLNDDTPEDVAYLATPDRLSFALGWVVASAIVATRYADSAIDALPVYHPETGWDRFLLTRRTTGKIFANETANRFGMLMLDGKDAPRLTKPSGADKITLGKALRSDPEKAVFSVLSEVRAGSLLPLDLGMRWRDRQRTYPLLYAAVSELIVEHPGVVAAREIYVDDQQVDGAYHPLYLHGAAPQPTMLYDWFLIQYGDRAAFFRTHGGQSIYETARGGWSTVKRQLSDEESVEGMKQRMKAWLRIEGEPDQQGKD